MISSESIVLYSRTLGQKSDHRDSWCHIKTVVSLHYASTVHYMLCNYDILQGTDIPTAEQCMAGLHVVKKSFTG